MKKVLYTIFLFLFYIIMLTSMITGYRDFLNTYFKSSIGITNNILGCTLAIASFFSVISYFIKTRTEVLEYFDRRINTLKFMKSKNQDITLDDINNIINESEQFNKYREKKEKYFFK